MRYLIDTPTPFDDLPTWESFLDSIQGLSAAAPEVQQAKAQAEREIEKRKRALSAD